jgi:hypothetical protein
MNPGSESASSLFQNNHPAAIRQISLRILTPGTSAECQRNVAGQSDKIISMVMFQKIILA